MASNPLQGWYADGCMQLVAILPEPSPAVSSLSKPCSSTCTALGMTATHMPSRWKSLPRASLSFYYGSLMPFSPHGVCCAVAETRRAKMDPESASRSTGTGINWFNW